jgi:hypothetical protein
VRQFVGLALGRAEREELLGAHRAPAMALGHRMT